MAEDMAFIYESSDKTYYKTTLVLLAILIGVLYFHAVHVHPKSDKALTQEQCIPKLKLAKHQLKVLTEHKNIIDKMLTQSLKFHEADKARFKNAMEYCAPMSQQSFICQNKIHYMEFKCNNIREEYEKVSKQLEELKNLTPSVQTTEPKFVSTVLMKT